MPGTHKIVRFARLICTTLLVLPALGANITIAQLRGHGGPVRALAVSPDGQSAISGSFDSTAIRWSLTRNAAERVLRFHADAVNAGGAAARRAGRDRRCRRAHCNLDAWQSRARYRAGRPNGADCRAGGLA